MSRPIVQRQLYLDADNPLEQGHYEKLKTVEQDSGLSQEDFENEIDRLSETEEKYLLSTFLYDYEIEAVELDGTIYLAIAPEPEEVESEAEEEPGESREEVTTPATTTPVAPPQPAIAPRKIRLGKLLNYLGYVGNNPRVKPGGMGSVSNGIGKSAKLHATQYLSNTSQQAIEQGTQTTTIMNDVFGGTPPLAYHLTAEVHGEKEPKKNPHLFHDGTYKPNQAQEVRQQDMQTAMDEERKRLKDLLDNPRWVGWT